MSNHQLHEFRQRLEEILAGMDSSFVPTMGLAASDVYDRASSEAESDLAVEAANMQWQTAKNARHALRRMESSKYGICQTCGDPIGMARLRALPWASRCIVCQSEDEHARVDRTEALSGGLQ